MIGKEATDVLDLKTLAGVDFKRPWGLVVSSDGEAVRVVGFIPTTGLEELMTSLAPMLGAATKNDDETFEFPGISLSGGELEVGGIAKAVDDWAYFATRVEDLEALPIPAEVLGDLPKKYEFAVRLYPQDIPEAMRELNIEDLPLLGMLPSMGENPLFDPQELFGDRMMEESQQITISFSTDKETKDLVFNVHAIPLADSATARQFSDLKKVTSRFASLLDSDNANLLMNFTGPLDDYQAERFKAQIDKYAETVLNRIDEAEEVASDEEREAFRELSGRMVDVARATISSKKADMAMRITGQGFPWTMVAATEMADTDQLAEIAQQMLDYGKDDPGLVSVSPNVAEYKGVKIHAFKLAEGGPNDAMLLKMFQSLEFYLGIGPETAFLAMGPKAVDEIKAAIDSKPGEVSPMHFMMPAGRWINLLASSSDDTTMRMILGMAALQLQPLETRGAAADIIEVTAHAAEDGMHIEAKAGPGFIRLGNLVMGMLPQILKQNP
jgi:hypothetical protein